MDRIKKEAFIKNLKVYSPINPFYKKEDQIEIKTLEQIAFYHKKIDQTYLVGEYLKNSSDNYNRKKKVIKDLIKYWSKDFYKYIEENKKEIISQIRSLRRYKIKEIELTAVSFFSLLIGVSLFLTKIFSNYNNYFIILVYLALIAVVYNLILYNYFGEVNDLQIDIKRFINDEFKKLNISFAQQKKLIKKHLFKAIRKKRIKEFYLKKILDYSSFVNKLTEHTDLIEDKVIASKKKHFYLIFLQNILNVLVFGFSIYIVYIMVIK